MNEEQLEKEWHEKCPDMSFKAWLIEEVIRLRFDELDRQDTIKAFQYDPKYGDEKICECGHPYYRHFDTYERMRHVGCKYCGCFDFKEASMETEMNDSLKSEIKELCITGLLTDGGHHKQWVLEQILEALGENLETVCEELLKDDYDWDPGIPP